MRVWVKVKANSKEDRVTKPNLKLFSDDREILEVWTKSQPVGGKANDSVLKLLSAHFGVSKSSVVLVSGATSKLKVFEIGK